MLFQAAALRSTKTYLVRDGRSGTHRGFIPGFATTSLSEVRSHWSTSIPLRLLTWEGEAPP